MKSYQLPLSHPEYKYPNARNIYAERLKNFSGKVFSDSDTENFSGRWRSLFPDAPASAPLEVEIGCNTGHVVREWAKRNPGTLYVGIDWKFKAIHAGLEKLEKAGLENLLFLRANTWRFQYIFGPEELDRISIFCPDPWPKKSQWKNRHLNAENISALRSRLKPGGVLHIKTDHEGYFDWILEHLGPQRGEWIIEDENRDLHASHPNPTSLEIPDVTLFEKIFIRDGIPIKQLILRRPDFPRF